MVQYASGSIRFSGLGSDYDFDSMIDKLLKIESRQVTQLMRWKQDWQTRLDAFKQLRGELMNVQTALKSMNSMSSFLAKSTVSSDDKVATATADADAMNTTYHLEVGRLATYATWTKGTGLHEKTDVIADTTGSFTYSYKGTYRTVNVPKGTTAEGLTKLINNDSKNPGVKAQLIQSADGITFQLRGMDTGKTNSLVIRETVNIKGLDVSLDNVNYEDSENMAKSLKDYATAGSVINDSGETKTFVYTLNGTRRIVEVTNGMTLQGLVDKINELTPGVARIDPNAAGNGVNLVLEKANTTYSAEYDPGQAGAGPFTDIVGKKDASNNWLVPPRDFTGLNEKILADGDPNVELKLVLNSSDGEQPNDRTYAFSVNKDTTVGGLINQIKLQLGDRGDVKLVKKEGSEPPLYNLQIDYKDKVHRVTVENGTLEDLAYTPPTDDSWDVVQGENAQVRVNGVPSKDSGKWMEVASNTLKSGEVIPGITFNLLKAGETTVGVTNDTEKMTENIQAFVDAINNFRTMLMSFTAYDEEKEVMDLEYAESQFEMQKGGVLMGNYGVQMLSSRLKDCIARSASGFLPRQYATDGSLVSGDVFSALSQIGITTNAQQGEANYGLLEINFISGTYGSMSLQEALDKDPEAVAALFAQQGEGKSNSDFFHYDSLIPGITKSGTHSVSYKINENGEIYDAYINNQPANIDNTNHTITAADGLAKGLSINVVEWEAIGEYNGTVSIKEGKINELLGLLEGSEGILGANGTLRNLEKNYQGIIDGIEAKIKREDERLARWEKTMLAKFSRLETVLARYNQIQGDLESQIAQLPKSSGK